MDVETGTLKGLVELLASGGSAATMVVAWFAFRAVQAGKAAADDIKHMRDTMTGIVPKVDKVIDNTRDISQQLTTVDNRMARQEMQLSAALAARYGTNRETGT